MASESYFLEQSGEEGKRARVSKIPTVRGADIMRDPKLTKVGILQYNVVMFHANKRGKYKGPETS